MSNGSLQMKAKNSLYAVAILTLVLATGVACSKPGKTDAQVSGDVQNQLSGDNSLQGKQVAVQASNGTVTLTGTVDNEAQKVAASNAASKVDGVKQVLNNLSVAPAQQMAAAQPEPEKPTAAEPEPTPAKHSSAAHSESHTSAPKHTH